MSGTFYFFLNVLQSFLMTHSHQGCLVPFSSLDNIVFVWGLVKAYCVGNQTSQLCSSKIGGPGLSQANPGAVSLWRR